MVLLHLLHLVGFGLFVPSSPIESSWRTGILGAHAVQAGVAAAVGVAAAGLRGPTRPAQRGLVVATCVAYLAFGAVVTGIDQLRDLSVVAFACAVAPVALLLDASAAPAGLLFFVAAVGAVTAIHFGQADAARRLSTSVNAVVMAALGFAAQQLQVYWRGRAWGRQRAAERATAGLEALNARLTAEIERRVAIEAELAELAHRDPLTMLHNRRAFLATLEKAARRADCHTLLLVDLDHFKAVNDELGHAGGDEALIKVCDVMRASVRTDDVVARLGGEELAVLLPDTGTHAGLRVAEALRQAIESARLGRPGAPLTVSVGVAGALYGETPTTWLSRADRALYDAKRAGRNAVAMTLD